MDYLADLTMRLVGGAARLPEGPRRRHAEFLRHLQSPDGGFPGRQGPADAYYTSFALRTLVLLGLLEEAEARWCAKFLADLLHRKSLPSIDFLSIVASDALLDTVFEVSPMAMAGLDRQAEVARRLDVFRRPDGGYAKTEQSGPSSTYHTFLAVATRQLVGLEEPEPSKIAALIRSRQRTDGGFVEMEVLRQSGTNPTAAAIGTLRLLNALDPSTTRGAVEFLRIMQTEDGGLRANTRIPIGDLLSTFTGLVALDDLRSLDTIDHRAALRFVENLELSDGGFLGGAWDATADAEYTFYGIGSMAILGTVGI